MQRSIVLSSFPPFERLTRYYIANCKIVNMLHDLANLMKERFGRSVIGRQVTAALLVEFVHEKIKEFWGKATLSQAHALSVKNGMLKIICTNAIIAQELKLKQSELIRAVENNFGSGAVKRVKIVQKGVEMGEGRW